MYQLPLPLPFTEDEYRGRVKKVQQEMARKGLDVLLITDPSNLYYLTGYDAESYYVDQVLVVSIEDEMPIFIGRYMDAFTGVARMTWLKENHIFAYPDNYVQNPEKHPMDWISSKLKDLGFGKKTIGIEIKADYITPYAWERYKANLTEATLVDGSLTVNYVRSVKSDKEIEYMMKAGKISEQMMLTFYETMAPGVRLCDVAAAVQAAAFSGTPEFGGECCASNMMFPRGIMGGAPHIQWDDQPLPESITIYLENAGVYKRYHAPFSRTLCLGEPPKGFIEISKVMIEGINAVMDHVKPGITTGELADIFGAVYEKHGVEKEARIGYTTGIGFFPSWGERIISIRSIDKTVLQPNMTFHLIPGMYLDQYGLSISQAFCVTENGAKKLYDIPYDVYVKR